MGNAFKCRVNVPHDFTQVNLGEIASHLYTRHSLKTRWRQRMRLAICPFDPIIAVVPPESRVLDVGCGEGLLPGLLLNLGRASTAVGIDVNAHRIRNARYMAETNGLGASAIFQHLRPDAAWPVEDTENSLYDVVTMIDVMHHLKPEMHDSVWHRAAEVLRPGGLLVCKDMAKRPLWMALATRIHDLLFSADWIHYADFENGVRRAREAGLVVQHHVVYSRLWYRHELLVFARL